MNTAESKLLGHIHQLLKTKPGLSASLHTDLGMNTDH